jgi:cell division protein FtsZ
MINVRMQPTDQRHNALAPRITVVGVGGAGGNAVNNMIATGLDGVEFLVCNTDAQALAGSRASKRIQLGLGVTAGLGAGTKPELGRAAAEEALEEIMDYIQGSHMVFITAGMGGGTGTGAAPVLAKACKDAGILTVGVVTKPFHFEGPVCMKAAESGIAEMQKHVDTLIVIPNQNLFRIANERTTFNEACKLADNVLQSAVRGVTDLMVMPGLVNLDFNDIKTTMTEMGKAMMGTGEATGDRRAVMAADAAINNPLLDDVTMKGAKGVIINIAGGADMTLFEIDEACNRIRDEVDPDANIIFGTSINESLEGAIRVTVLATGIETEAERQNREGQGGRTAPKAFSYGGPRANANETRPVHNFATPTTTAATTEPRNAQIIGQSFIPPAPVEYDQLGSYDRTVPYEQIIAGVPASDAPAAPVMAPAPVMTPVVAEPMTLSMPMGNAPFITTGLVEPTTTLSAPEVNTPGSPEPSPAIVKDMGQQMVTSHTRRVAPTTPEPALTLFQRITQRVRQTMEQAFDDRDEDMIEPQPTATAHRYQARVQPAVTSQAMPAAAREPVSVAKAAMPSPNGQTELDLEIPAFLRRQAS